MRASQVKNPPASAGDTKLTPGSGRPPGGGHGNPLQYFCLEDPMDRGAGGLQSIRSERVGCNSSDGAAQQMTEMTMLELSSRQLCS